MKIGDLVQTKMTLAPSQVNASAAGWEVCDPLVWLDKGSVLMVIDVIKRLPNNEYYEHCFDQKYDHMFVCMHNGKYLIWTRQAATVDVVS